MALAWRAAAVSGGAILAVLAAAALPAAQAQASSAPARAVPAARSARVIPATLARAIHKRLGPGLIGAPAATWTNSSTPSATLSNEGKTGNTLGFSVALSQDDTTALVGAWAVGAAYIFHAAHGDWVTSSAPTATLTNASLPTGQGFGWSVALSSDGTTALIGDLYAGSNAGAACVYHVAAEGSWTKMTSPTATLTRTGPGNFGASVALSADGSTALIGASLGSSGGSSGGAAYIFHAAAESSWASTSSPTATLTHTGGGEEELGGAVALSADGTTALVAAFGAGAAYIFHTAAEGGWTSASSPGAVLTDGGTSTSNGLGWSVALSADGTTALTGSWFVDNGTGGAAYIFQASAETAWTSTATPAATLTNAAGKKEGRFGYSVALSADASQALIGSSGQGSAFVYPASPASDRSSLSVSTHWRPQLSPPRTVVTFRAVDFPATQASLALRIYARSTGQQLYFIKMVLSDGAGALWRALPCGSYQVKYHHGDGTLGFRYFTVTDGGTCP
jgi:hypothetical protein